MTDSQPYDGAGPVAASRGHDLAERSRLAVWHPCTQMQALQQTPVLPIVRAEGPWLFDADGQRWFDGISSWWTCLLGHRQADVVAALHAQLDTLDHVMLAGFTHAPAVELAERLGSLTGGQLPHVSFASDGSSALEIALKQSAHAWLRQGQAGKHRFICLAESYHGETLGALGVTHQPVFTRSYHALLRDALVVSGPDAARAARDGITAEQDALAAADRLDSLLQAQSGSVAAVVLEPLLQGAGGMRMYHPRYLQEVRRLCSAHQVHWIADEIATGCGRTGSFFAVEQAGVWPDLLCLSKGLSGGMLPLSVTLSSAAIFKVFLGDSMADAFLHSHSFSGNPLACRAALATLDVLQQQQVLAANVLRATRIDAALAVVRTLPHVSDYRRIGMVWAFEMAGGVAQARTVQAKARQAGLLVRPLGNTVYLMPPFLLSDAECTWVGETLAQAVRSAALADGGPSLSGAEPVPRAAIDKESRIA